MKNIINILIIANTSQACNNYFRPNIIPDIIIEVSANHVYQAMSELEKLKCSFINDYLDTQTSYFLSAHQNFVKAIENFSSSATNHNCQEILDQLTNIFYGKWTTSKNIYPIDYNYIKSLLFSRQNSPSDKAYFNSLITGNNLKFTNYVFQQIHQPIYYNLKYHYRYFDKSKNNLLNINITDMLSQKIKDALAPTSKDDLKKLEIIYKYIIKKTSSWLINFKNFVK